MCSWERIKIDGPLKVSIILSDGEGELEEVGKVP